MNFNSIEKHCSVFFSAELCFILMSLGIVTIFSRKIDNIIVTMDDQKDNALSINICIKYKLVVFEPRHTKAVFLAGETKRILLHFHLIVTNYYVRDRNVRNPPQIQYVIKMSAHFSTTALTSKKSFIYVCWQCVTFGSV